jgi:putative transposase
MSAHEFWPGKEFSIKGVDHIISAVAGEHLTVHYKRGGPPVQLSRTTLVRLLETNVAKMNATTLSTSGLAPVNTLICDLPEEEAKIATFRYACIIAVERQRVLEERTITAKEIKEKLHEVAIVAQCKPLSLATYYRWRSRFERSGRRVESLVDRDDRKGNHSERLDAEVRHLIELAIENWLKPHRPTKQWAFSILIGRIIEANEARPLDLQLPLVSFTTFCRLTEKLDPYLVATRRYGENHAKVKFRTRAGGPRPTRPLERLEIDHTPLDVIIVNTLGVTLGRPYATVAICGTTRAILAIHISFTPPSYLSVMRCLYQAILPKSCKIGGVQVTSNDWLSYGMPEELICDNGPEFVGLNLEAACSSLGIGLKFMPRGQPWFKGRIERFLRSLGTGLIHNVSGTTKENILMKGEYRPEKDLLIELPFLKEIALRWTVDIYMQSLHRGIGTSPAMAWQRAIANSPVVPIDPSLPLEIILGMNFKRTVSNGRISLNCLQYYSPVLSLLFTAGQKDRTVSIKLDPEDIGIVYVLHPDDGIYFAAYAVETDYASGLPLYVHELLLVEARVTNRHEIDTKSIYLAKLKLARDIDKELRTKSTKAKSRHSRVEQWAQATVEQALELDTFDNGIFHRAELESGSGKIRLNADDNRTDDNGFSTSYPDLIPPSNETRNPQENFRVSARVAARTTNPDELASQAYEAEHAFQFAPLSSHGGVEKSIHREPASLELNPAEGPVIGDDKLKSSNDVGGTKNINVTPESHVKSENPGDDYSVESLT